MPTLIVEDGSMASASANSYVTVAEVTTFCEDYGLSQWAALAAIATSDQIPSILRGMAYIESLSFKGEKYEYDNPLEWPRILDDDEWDEQIPPRLKMAVCRAAYEEAISPGVLQPNLTNNIKSEKVDVLSVEYFDSKPPQTIYSSIAGFLKGLVQSGNYATLLRT